MTNVSPNHQKILNPRPSSMVGVFICWYGLAVAELWRWLGAANPALWAPCQRRPTHGGRLLIYPKSAAPAFLNC